jgi:restriction system protein
MPVPLFNDFIGPLLKFAADENSHSLKEARSFLKHHFKLSDTETQEKTRSGKKPKFDDRVQWARTYLVMAGCLEAPSRGVFRITKRGQELFKQKGLSASIDDLKGFQEFLVFQAPQEQNRKTKLDIPVSSEALTPEERIEHSYEVYLGFLKADLLKKVRSCSPSFFESLVVELVVAMGYGGSIDAAKTVGRTGDGGIDGLINQDKLGLDTVYIQAKRWAGTVGRPVVSSFVGSLSAFKARKGIVITSGGFSDKARSYVKSIKEKVILIDGNDLVGLLIDHNIGVTPVKAIALKKLSLDYFDEGSD